MDSRQMYGDLISTFCRILPKTAYGDVRRLMTLAWAIIGLASSRTVSLTDWAEVVLSSAQYPASRVRCFARWLNTPQGRHSQTPVGGLFHMLNLSAKQVEATNSPSFISNLAFSPNGKYGSRMPYRPAPNHPWRRFSIGRARHRPSYSTALPKL